MAAIPLFERWKWTPRTVENLDVQDFLYYLERVSAIYEAESKAMRN